MGSQSAYRKTTQELTDADFMDSSVIPEETTSTKRQYPRRPAKWMVTVKTTKGQKIKGKTVNVSKEGMMISLPYNLKLGSKAFIEAMVLYRGSQFNLQGVTTVKHSSISGNMFNLGLQFTVATDATTQFLTEYTLKKP